MKNKSVCILVLIFSLGLLSGAQQGNENSDGSNVSGKVFLVTKAGDLKPARGAQVILLYGKDDGTANVFYLNKKFEKMMAARHQLATPGEASCVAELQVFNASLKESLDWSRKNGKETQARIVGSDEEGTFRFASVQPGSYTVVAWGHAGANNAYWERTLEIESGKDIAIKLGSPHTACLD